MNLVLPHALRADVVELSVVVVYQFSSIPGLASH